MNDTPESRPAHEPVFAEGLPKPIGPYVPGITFDRLVIVSGQGATDPATGELAGDDVERQTEQVFRNIEAILKAAGTDLSHVLRCGVFLVDLRDFDAMNAVYARVFGDHRPARTTVQVASLPDKGLRVEIDAIAYRP
jgi:2-iminobutanoate/2-iminopropanoate deaminase